MNATPRTGTVSAPRASTRKGEPPAVQARPVGVEISVDSDYLDTREPGNGGELMGATEGPGARPGVLIVDDDPTLARYLARSLEHAGYRTITAGSGVAGLDVLARHDVGVVISDQAMPGMDGITFLVEARRLKPETVRIMLTAHGGFDHAREAINRSQIFGYLTKPCALDEVREMVSRAFERFEREMKNRSLRLEMEARNRRFEQLIANLRATIRAKNEEIHQMFREGVMTLALVAEARDDVTGDHVRRIACLVKSLCLEMALDHETAERTAYSSMMHDVGKIHIPDAVLKKPGPLSPTEWRVMKSHTVAGARILAARRFEMARQIARHHHERWDGSGYPDGLRAGDIPFEARIVTVADVFDALTHDRPYKPAWSVDRALETMRGQMEEAFDPDILRLFMDLVTSGRLPTPDPVPALDSVTADADRSDPES